MAMRLFPFRSAIFSVNIVGDMRRVRFRVGACFGHRRVDQRDYLRVDRVHIRIAQPLFGAHAVAKSRQAIAFGTDAIEFALPAIALRIAFEMAEIAFSIEFDGSRTMTCADICLLYTSPSPRD